MRRHFASFAAALLVVCAACSERKNSETPNDSAAASPAPSEEIRSINACALLTSAEIEAAQGEPVKEAKETVPPSAGLTISQCFFTLPTYVKSVSLQVVQRGAGSAGRNPREVWSEMFSPQKLQAMETEGGAKKRPPEPVPDLGEEAYCIGGPAPVLHVRDGNRYIRLSVGGSFTETEKRDKCVALARLVLPRL